MDYTLFPDSVLTELASHGEWTEHLDRHRMRLRPLQRDDHRHGFIPLLSQLTDVGTLDSASFTEQFLRMSSTVPLREYVCVIERLEGSKEEKQVVAAATLQIEYKFIHSAALRARIEDVVVHEDFRGLKLAKILLTTLIELSRKLGAYKISLDAKDPLISFYEKFGFNKDQGNNFMIQRFSSQSVETVEAKTVETVVNGDQQC